MGRFKFASPSLSKPSSATWPRRTVACVRERNSSNERMSEPILRLSFTTKERKMLTRASNGIANGILLSTPRRGDRNAIERFEMGRERVGATNCSSSPLLLWHDIRQRQSSAAETKHCHSHSDFDERVNVDPFVHQPMARRREWPPRAAKSRT